MHTQHIACSENKTIQQGWIFINRNMKMIVVVAMALGMYNIFSSLLTAKDHAMAAKITQQYSDVSSIEDLQKRYSLIKDRCSVCEILLKIVHTVLFY